MTDHCSDDSVHCAWLSRMRRWSSRSGRIVGSGMQGRIDRLHLGCGLNTPAGWLNLDGSWNARLAQHPTLHKLLIGLRLVPQTARDITWDPDIYIHDVRKALPFQEDSFSAVYASHLLEHLYHEEAKRLLDECFRVLRPGGIIRLVVPDLEAMVREYQSSDPPSAVTMPGADILNEKLLMRSRSAPKGNLLYRVYSCLLDFHSHKWMYDAESLSFHLRQAGFLDVTQMQCHQSRIAGIEQIERASSFTQGSGVCVEAVKPNPMLLPDGGVVSHFDPSE